MKPSRRLLVFLFLLPLFGWGCLQIGPRIVRVPDAPPAASSTPGQEPQSATAQAYLNVDGGAADVIRAGTAVHAQEGTELATGDEVSVTSGTVTLVYPDAGESKLDSGSKVVILSDGAQEGSLFTEVHLFAGNIWTRFEKVFGPGERFSVSANGVVATVRGTAFGVSLQGSDVDVQVAEHDIEVTSQADEEAAVDVTTTTKVVRIAAGEGIKLRSAQFAALSGIQLKGLTRTLTAAERVRAGFLFGLRKIPAESLKRPLRTFRLPIVPRIPQDLLQRMTFLRARAAFEARLRGFVAPTRGVLQNELAPINSTIQIQGPTSTAP